MAGEAKSRGARVALVVVRHRWLPALEPDSRAADACDATASEPFRPTSTANRCRTTPPPRLTP
jgi:hypothetical protein